MRVSFLAVSLAVYKGALAAPADASVSENKNIKAKHWDGGPDVMPNFQDDQGNGYGVVSAPNRQTQYLPRIACDPNNVGNSPYCPNYRPNQGYGNGYRPPPYGIGPACDANDPGCQLPHPTNQYGNGHPPCDSNNMYGNPNCANYYPNQHFGPGPACDPYNTGNYPNCPNYRPNHHYGDGLPPYHDIQHFGSGPACDPNNVNNNSNCPNNSPRPDYSNELPSCDSEKKYNNPYCYDH